MRLHPFIVRLLCFQFARCTVILFTCQIGVGVETPNLERAEHRAGFRPQALRTEHQEAPTVEAHLLAIEYALT